MGSSYDNYLVIFLFFSSFTALILSNSNLTYFSTGR